MKDPRFEDTHLQAVSNDWCYLTTCDEKEAKHNLTIAI